MDWLAPGRGQSDALARAAESFQDYLVVMPAGSWPASTAELIGCAAAAACNSLSLQQPHARQAARSRCGGEALAWSVPKPGRRPCISDQLRRFYKRQPDFLRRSVEAAAAVIRARPPRPCLKLFPASRPAAAPSQAAAAATARLVVGPPLPSSRELYGERFLDLVLARPSTNGPL